MINNVVLISCVVARQFVLDLFFFKFSSHLFPWISLVAQLVKNPPEMQETRVRSLGWEDPLEERMATHSSIHPWRIPVDRGAWWATVHGLQRIKHD